MAKKATKKITQTLNFHKKRFKNAGLKQGQFYFAYQKLHKDSHLTHEKRQKKMRELFKLQESVKKEYGFDAVNHDSDKEFHIQNYLQFEEPKNARLRQKFQKNLRYLPTLFPDITFKIVTNPYFLRIIALEKDLLQMKTKEYTGQYEKKLKAYHDLQTKYNFTLNVDHAENIIENALDQDTKWYNYKDKDVPKHFLGKIAELATAEMLMIQGYSNVNIKPPERGSPRGRNYRLDIETDTLNFEVKILRHDHQANSYKLMTHIPMQYANVYKQTFKDLFCICLAGMEVEYRIRDSCVFHTDFKGNVNYLFPENTDMCLDIYYGPKLIKQFFDNAKTYLIGGTHMLQLTNQAIEDKLISSESRSFCQSS